MRTIIISLITALAITALFIVTEKVTAQTADDTGISKEAALLTKELSIILDEVTSGPKVGDKIPSTLQSTTASGEPTDFESLKGENGLVILFIRSVEWCPFCQRQIIAWDGRVDDFREAGYEVVAITYDTPNNIEKFVAFRNIGYPIVADENSKIIREFDILNEQFEPGSRFYGIPHPIIFVTDNAGTITHRYSASDVQVRPDIDAVLEEIS